MHDATFFTADEHYGHANIINFCNRPFANVDEMREALIARHNAKVPKGGITYHVGDMFWRKVSADEAYAILERLNGQHFFVWGNHDEVIENSRMLRSRFVWCKDIACIDKTAETRRIMLCHYPMRTWRGSHRGDWHLYGHEHGNLPDHGFSFDCGVDANNWEPVSLAEVAARMAQKGNLNGTAS